MRSVEDQQTRAFYELCALLLTVIRSPPGSGPPPPRRRSQAARRGPQLTPTAFASLLLGVSLALMLCGSVTFVIGFMLMPWVLGFVMVLYFFGIVSCLSGLGRAILCPNPPSVSRSNSKEVQGHFLSKVPII